MVLFDPTREAGEARAKREQTANQTRPGDVNVEPEIALLQETPVMPKITDYDPEHVSFLLRPVIEPLLKAHDKTFVQLRKVIEELYRWRSFIDTPVYLSSNVFWEVDYKERTYLFLYTPVQITVLAQGGFSIVAPAYQWTPILLPRGAHITASGVSDASPQYVIMRACDEYIATALGPGANVIGSVTLGAGSNNVGNVGILNAGDASSNSTSGFWNAAAVLASGVSAVVNVAGYARVRIFVNTSVADTFNVQISNDGGTTWHTLTQDNAGTPVIIATTASQLLSCRDIATFGWSSIRLFAVGAATVTAGLQVSTL